MPRSENQPALHTEDRQVTAAPRRAGGQSGQSGLHSAPEGTGADRGGFQRVDVRRSARRRRTVSAYRDGDTLVVLIPARFSRAEEARWVERMAVRLAEPSATDRRSDAELLDRATQLSGLYLGDVRPVSVRWVAPMRTRWASCTPAHGSIRVSSRLAEMPDWVLDYVLVHELAHLLVAAHDDRFWALVGQYPRTERARGYLDGVSAAANLDITDDLTGDITGDTAGPDGNTGPAGNTGGDGDALGDDIGDDIAGG